LQATVQDQYGNPVQGATVTFEPVNRFSNHTDLSNESGQAGSVYITPLDADSSIAKAYVSGLADTAYFKVYGITYVANSLKPKVANPGDTVVFRIHVSNPGTADVNLDMSNTIFSFTDEIDTVSAVVDSPAVLSGGNTNITMRFQSAIIDTSFTAGNYTPQVQFAGTGDDINLNGVLTTDAGELSIEPLQIDYIDIQDPAEKAARRGETLSRILMRATNGSTKLMSIDQAELTFDPDEGFVLHPYASNPTQIQPGDQADFYFSVDVPQNAALGNITVDGTIYATITATGTQIFDTHAAQTDQFAVTAGIQLTYRDFAPKTVSENQNTAFTMDVQNDGAYDFLLNQDSTRLVFGSQTFNLDGNQTIGPNDTTRLRFSAQNVQLSAGSKYAGTLYLQGTENGSLTYDTLYTASGGDSLTVQRIANLEISSVTLTDTVVARGEEGDTLKIALNNAGEATAVIVSADSVSISYNSSYTLTPVQTFPYELLGGLADTLFYKIKVAADAPTGLDTFRVQIAFQDQNSELNYQESKPGIYDSWRVIQPGAVTVLSVTGMYDSVSTGQDSIPVQVRVENSGHYDIRVDSLRLNLQAQNYVASTLFRSVSRTLQPAQRDTFMFSVSVRTDAVSGTQSLNASAYATNLYDQSVVSDLAADTTDSWLVQQAVAVVVTDNQPVRISSGQNVSPTALVRNDGEADLLADTSKTRLEITGNPSFSRKLIGPTLIPGNSSTMLYFESGEGSGASGSYSVELHLEGTENHSHYSNNLPAPNDLTIQSQATLVIDSVVAAAENITQSADTTLNVYISNTGEAALIVDTVQVIPYGSYSSITPPLPYTISGSARQRFEVRLTVPSDAATGAQTLDARAVGRDSNWVNTGIDSTVSDDGATVTDSWNVFTPPSISVTSITAPDSVVDLAQENIPVQIRIANSGGAPALITGLALHERIGLYVHSYPALNFTVAGGGDTTVTDYVDVKANSATGKDTLKATVDYSDLYSTVSASSADSDSLIWRISSGQAAISIVSVSASHERVSLGQQTANVKVRVRNDSDSPVTLDSLQLHFSHNDTSAYEFGSISPALGSLDAYLEQTYTVPLSVKETALTGVDTISARVHLSEDITGKIYWVSDSTINDAWTVQQRPQISIQSVTMQPDSASTGQQDLSGAIVIANAAGTYRADAQIDSVKLNLVLNSQNQNTRFNINRDISPSLPALLPAGKNLSFTFNVDVSDTALSGGYAAEGHTRYEDVNDGSSFTVDTAQTPGSLTVQQKAQLDILSMWVVPDTVHQTQQNAHVYMRIFNSGETAAQINSATISFNPGSPDIDFNPVLINRSTPFTIAGGQLDTLIYAIEINTSTYAGNVQVSGMLKGEDALSQASIQDDSTNAASFEILTPADLHWVNTTPSQSAGNENVVFDVTLRNDGQSTVEVDTTRSYLEIWNDNLTTAYFQIYLSDTSALQIVANSQQTNLIFKETYLSGMDQGTYRLLLTLRGSSTGDPTFDQQLNVGTLAYGDSLISITQITVNKENVVWGETGIHASMFVSNSVGPKSIDKVGTKLIFKDQNGGMLTVDNYQRTDTLTVLQKQNNNELTFTFDIPPNFYTGTMYVYGQISLDGGADIIESTTRAEMQVASGGEAHYVEHSLSPDTAVARQVISFRTAFTDSGTADLTLIPDSTFIRFVGAGMSDIYLAGRYTLTGRDAQSGKLDTSFVTFAETTLPENIATGKYDLYWQAVGELPDGQHVHSNGTSAQALAVIASADVAIARVSIDSARVRRGQKQIPVHLSLTNRGASGAVVRALETNFVHIASGLSVADQWLVSGAPAFPDTLLAGQSRNYDYLFNVTDDATLGDITTGPQVSFSDLRTTQLTDVGSAVLLNDTVTVISPAVLRIDSLVVNRDAQAPNAPYVNTSRPFNLKLFVTNLGADTVRSAYLRLFRENDLLSTVVLHDIAAGQTAEYLQQTTLSGAGGIEYKALADSAFDLTHSRISIAQPLDNVETVIAQRPALLQLTAVISAPSGARDSVVSSGQTFTVRATVNNSGGASFGAGQLRLNLPANYHLAGDTISLRSFTMQTEYVDWQVTADQITGAQPFDTLWVAFQQIPLDVNTGQPAQLVRERDDVEARTLAAGQITVQTPAIAEPAGALDGMLSTGQSFTVRTQFTFNQAIADSGRSARIELPTGFSLTDSTRIDLSAYQDQDTVSWRVVAAAEAREEIDPIRVFVSGIDENSGLRKETISAGLSVDLVPRTLLNLSLKVVEPAGAMDDTLSAGQVFRLQAEVKNRVDAAAVSGQGQAAIQFGDRFELVDAQGTATPADSVRSFTVGTPFSWWLRVTESAAPNASLPANAALTFAEVFANEGVKVAPNGVELATVLPSNEVAVQIRQAPLDENSSQPALLQNAQENKSFVIEGAAQIKSVTLIAQDTLSTGQTFVLTLQADLKGNVGNATGRIILPPMFTTTQPTELPLNENGQAVWNLKVAEGYSGSGLEQITTELLARDINSGSTLYSQKIKEIVVQRHTVVTMHNFSVQPFAVANTGLVSRGQEIELSVTTGYYKPIGSTLPMAPFIEQGVLMLDSTLKKQGFTLKEGYQWEQAFSDTTQTLSWIVKAPQTDLTANMKLQFTQLPLDKNSRQKVAVAADSGVVVFPVRVRKKSIMVTLDNSIVTDTTFSKAEANVPIISFKVSNKDYDDPLHINGVEVGFYMTSAQPSAETLLSSSAVRDMLQSVSVVDISEYRAFLQKQQSGAKVEGYIDYSFSDTTANPVMLNFTREALLPAAQDAQFVVLVKFQNNVLNRGFRAVLKNVRAYDFDAGHPLEIIDESGAKIEESENMESRTLTIISGDAKDAFGNYPNPFGRTYKQTNIKFRLDDPSDVDIRIFTLVGELVWKKSIAGLSAGLYDNLFKWDGRNGRGQTVLNGVYVCVLNVKPTNGKPAKNYITKIAFIK